MPLKSLLPFGLGSIGCKLITGLIHAVDVLFQYGKVR